MEGERRNYADQLPKEEVGQMSEEDLRECAHSHSKASFTNVDSEADYKWSSKRGKPIIFGDHESSKGENPETYGYPLGPDFCKVEKSDSCHHSEMNSAKELGKVCSNIVTNAMENSMEAIQYSTLLDEGKFRALQGSFTNLLSAHAIQGRQSLRNILSQFIKSAVESKVSGKGHPKQQKTQENNDNKGSKALDGDTRLFTGQFQDCARDGVHTSHLQYYQRRLRKGKDENTLLITPSQHRGKTMCKSILGLDLSTSVTCTPSYRLLPMKYLRTSSHLHPLRAEVLNDYWVCVPSGSQNYHLKHAERNPYEEKLQQCEDDRCELDVFLECIRAATGRIEQLLISLGSGEEILLDDHLTAIDLRCCERLYGVHGSECKDMIQKNPSAALPVLLDRLKQKQDQLLSTREVLDKCWREVYSDKYKQSFENRSTLTTKDAKSGIKKESMESMTMTKQEARSLARKRRGFCN